MNVLKELEDEPTSKDLLGFERLANPIAEIIYNNFNKNTQTTIGVYGDWGSGKTSFLQMLAKSLNEKSLSAKDRNRLKNDNLSEKDKKKIMEKGICPIWFYAWKYDKEDNLWAALIQKILDEARVNGRLYRRAWVKFQIWKDSITLYRGIWEVFKKLLALFIRIIVIFIGLYIFLGLDKHTIETFLKQWLPTNPLIPTSVQANIVKVFGAIAAAAAAGTGAISLINLLNAKLGIDFSKFRRKPSYKEHIAFLDEFSKEFEKIVRLIGKGKPLVVIIDDLDRCLPEKAIQVLEAIKNFLDAKGCVFILGLDRKLVEQAIAVKYKEATNAEKDGKDQSKDDSIRRRVFYEDYIDKIIQLSISLPRLSRNQIKSHSQIKDFVEKLSLDEDIKFCASIFGVGLPPNPRKIKRILRSFIFVRDRVADDIIKGNIKLSILAKLIVIQHQLPQIFEAVIERSKLLEELENYYVAQNAKQVQPDAAVEPEKFDPLLRDQAEQYRIEYPELRRILLEEIDSVNTFTNVDIDHYISLVGALAEIKPYAEELSYASYDNAYPKLDIVDLDDTLFRLIPILSSSQDIDASARRLIMALLRDSTQVFAGKVYRALLLLPNELSREYLTVWASYQMPAERISRLTFYIGSDEEGSIRRRGVAGQAFFEQKIIVGHLIQKDDKWVSDNVNYIDFDKDRPFAPYRSFVAVPIIGTSNLADSSMCLGVVCYDSNDPTVFDSPASQTLLRAISTRFAAAISTYQNLLSKTPSERQLLLKGDNQAKTAMEQYLSGNISLDELKHTENLMAQDSKKL